MLNELAIMDTQPAEPTFLEEKLINAPYSHITIYNRCIAAMETRLGILAMPDGASAGFHSFYKLKTPAHKGLENSKPIYSKLQSPKELNDLKADIFSMRKAMLAEPLDALDTYSALMLVKFPEQWAGEFANQGSILLQEEANYLIQSEAMHGISTKIGVLPSNQVPHAYIPMLEDFSLALQERNLELSDLLKIFPEAELECFRLALGRTLAGPDNSTPAGLSERLNKGWKCAVACLGEPSTGKSAFLNAFRSAITTQGYSCSTFRNVSDQFGMGRIVSSHFASCDDSTTAMIVALLKSALFKTIVTNGTMPCEAKFMPVIDTTSITTLFINANNVDYYKLQDADEGAHIRLFLLGTESHEQMNLQYGEKSNWVFPALLRKYAKELDCDEHTIVLWLARKCLNEYLSYDNDGYSVQARMLELKPLLKERAVNEITTSYGQAISLATQIAEQPAIFNSSESLVRGLEALLSLAYCESQHENRGKIRADYKAKGCPLHHPWRVLRCFSYGSAKQIESSLTTLRVLPLREALTALLNMSYDDTLSTFGKSNKRLMTALNSSLFDLKPYELMGTQYTKIKWLDEAESRAVRAMRLAEKPNEVG